MVIERLAIYPAFLYMDETMIKHVLGI